MPRKILKLLIYSNDQERAVGGLYARDHFPIVHPRVAGVSCAECRMSGIYGTWVDLLSMGKGAIVLEDACLNGRDGD
jgi:hypothetical protein